MSVCFFFALLSIPCAQKAVLLGYFPSCLFMYIYIYIFYLHVVGLVVGWVGGKT